MKVLLLGLILIAGSGCAGPQQVTRSNFVVVTPQGYVTWAKTYKAPQKKSPPAHSNIWRVLFSTQKEAHRRFTYVGDPEQYNKAEHWVVLKDVPRYLLGDCEDFALLARQILLEQGLSEGRLAVVKTAKGGIHAVLEYQGWVIDNRRTAPVHYGEDGYTWVKIEGPDGKWYQVVHN